MRRISTAVVMIVATFLAATGLLAANAAAQAVYPPDVAQIEAELEAEAEGEIEAEVLGEVVQRVQEVIASDPEVQAALDTFADLFASLGTTVLSSEQVDELLDGILDQLRAAMPDLDIQTIVPLAATVDPITGELSIDIPAEVLFVDPATGKIATATIGAGMAPGSIVTITVESTPIEVGKVAADDKGVFLTVVELPAGLSPGRHTLKASGTDPSGNQRILGQPIEIREAPTQEDADDQDERTELAAPAGAVGPTSGGGSNPLVPIFLGGGAVLLVAGAFALARRTNAKPTS